jgi:SAM-dependent methyltransferase
MPNPRDRSRATESWEDAYLRFETPEAEVAKFLSRLRHVGAERWPRDARVVELFCGRGNGLVAFERLGFTQVSGVDLSARLVREYRGDAACIVGDCCALPVREESHDVAVVQGGLHHLPALPGDLARVLGEVHRVLRPRGLLVLVEPWLTPFLRLVHRACDSPARRVWGKLDALATMIEYEEDTYRQWLGQPRAISTLLTQNFDPVIDQRRWGKLVFVGRKRARAC